MDNAPKFLGPPQPMSTDLGTLQPGVFPGKLEDVTDTRPNVHPRRIGPPEDYHIRYLGPPIPVRDYNG